MNIKKRFKGIEFKTLLFITIFNIGIILIIYLSELFIFDVLYKNYQINKVNNIVEEFNTSKEDVYVLAENLAYDNEVCISVINENMVSFNYNTMQNGCPLNKKNKFINNKINNFVSSDNESEYYRITNPMTETKGILYAVKKDNNNIFIYSNLKNTSNFINVFQNQIVYFIILIIFCSVFISFFLANKITKPIREITNKSKLMNFPKRLKKSKKN